MVTPTRLKRLLIAFLLTVATTFGIAVTTTTAAHADDCFAGIICGYVVNGSDTGLVAASLDKYGGNCPYPGGKYSHCGTCYVAPGDVSDPDCNSVFRDTDTYTYQYNSYIFVDQNKWYSANQYIYPHMPSDRYAYCWRNYDLYILECESYVQ